MIKRVIVERQYVFIVLFIVLCLLTCEVLIRAALFVSAKSESYF